MDDTIICDTVVLGAGPGGYSAAFRAADLGEKVVLIERHSNLGGVCLNVGCIPSKTLLHAAKTITETQEIMSSGIKFTEPTINLENLRNWKNNTISRLTAGLSNLAEKRQITVLHGQGIFNSKHKITVDAGQKITTVKFKHAIIATGSKAISLPFMPDDPRIISSTGALELSDIPAEMLIIGGGIIGLEMATVYAALGSEITVTELASQIVPNADTDLITPLYRKARSKYKSVMLETKVTAIESRKEGLLVSFEGKNAPKQPQLYDKVLLSIGRKPSSTNCGLEKIGIKIDERGFVIVDEYLRTSIPHLYAVGDVIGSPMLAHKAVHEGRLAAELITKVSSHRNIYSIPSVAYTDPELAWVGLTEKEAAKKNIKYGIGSFPWLASGRSLSIGRTEGITKLLFDPKTHKLLGAGIVGSAAGELIPELTLAITMGCKAENIATTIHPHPTLSETIMMAAEMFLGTITDLYPQS